ncbi:MAG: helix-hairpin-helix domain-containing protein [Synergistaceae bacterium]|jgi:competence protein ComEA|nr:helix-hairpin-helix domain-containing protein [Synergistaceae bacterium]
MTAGAGLALFAIFLVVLLHGKFSPMALETDNAAPPTPEFAESSPYPDDEYFTRPAGNWVVYVTGSVMRPGVYEVPHGSRMNDAVRIAGGFSVRADPEAVNLAEKIEDGVHIRIPQRDATASETVQNNPSGSLSIVQEPPSPVDAGGATSGAPVITRPKNSKNPANDQKSESAPGKIDINSAAAEELQSLPGVGPSISAAIVEYRSANGPFFDTSDLMKVRGIGQKRFEAVRDLITVSR